ncbi:XRE family transcriptional regulator [Ruegeria faecimaris]|uniref:XRE family transcriptional regulator n=1 Tax=Ruegeria faecimaris TaxID=686389 RepID=UPI0024900FDC|nr:XRE family transcriptional regulator [Ruegeria faecimaris]
MFPKMGKTFPDDDEWKVDRLKYQVAIAAALKRELGGSHRAIKIVMRWTGVSERTAKNWLAGSHGPAGEHLVELMRNSNEVLAAVLSLAGRGELRMGAGLHETRQTLLQLLQVLDGLLGTSEAGVGENE